MTHDTHTHTCVPPRTHLTHHQHRVENGKLFEEVVLDKVIAEEREWRSKTDIDVQMGIARDEKTQLVLAVR